MNQKESVLVIGAGISGLLIANALNGSGYQVKVLDKGRGVGGRMSTKRFASGRVDHGAQFFTARGESMKSLVTRSDLTSIIQTWSHGFAKSGQKFQKDGFPRYSCLNGMSSLPKYLAQNLNVEVSCKIESIHETEGGWAAKQENGVEHHSDILINTAPVPQAIEMLEKGKMTLSQPNLDCLKSIQYNPSFALLLRLNGPSAIPSPGGLTVENSIVSWIADNSQKGLPTPAGSSLLTIHSTGEFAKTHFETDKHWVESTLLEAAKEYLGADIVESHLHRWKFAQSLQLVEPGYLKLDSSNLGIIAGDGFGGGKVEGAVLSASSVIEFFNQT